MDPNSLVLTQRERLVADYAAQADDGQTFSMTTRPYHSTAQLVGEVVGPEGGNGVSYVVFRGGQELTFFNFGIGGQIQLGNTAVRATEAETNLIKPASTNDAADFVIEGVGVGLRGMRCRYNPATIAAEFGAGDAPTDADVVAALAGDANICDPAAILFPPQLQSPFNLENAHFQAAMKLMSLTFNFGGRRFERLGLLDLLPEAGASSYLRSNGEPHSENRYRIDEGFLWRRDGQPDCDFTATVKLHRALVMPINLVDMPGGDGTPPAPTHVYLEICMRVFGVALELPSAN